MIEVSKMGDISRKNNVAMNFRLIVLLLQLSIWITCAQHHRTTEKKSSVAFLQDGHPFLPHTYSHRSNGFTNSISQSERAFDLRMLTDVRLQKERINSIVVVGQFGMPMRQMLNRTTEYLFEFNYNASDIKDAALRVSVSSEKSDYRNPVLVVVRQQRGVLSFQLPLEPPKDTLPEEEYHNVSRTLCPVNNYKTTVNTLPDQHQRLFVDVSTSSPFNVSFTVRVDFEYSFVIKLGEERHADVTPSQPVFYEFRFPDDVEMVLVQATALDDFCAMVSIQNITCPVFDCEENIQYSNFYQTMTYQAGITVRKANYPNGLYIVLVVLTEDEACSASFRHIIDIHREKKVTLLVEEKITELEYLAAIFAGLGFCFFFYIVTLILACISYIRAKRKGPLQRSLLDDSLISPEDGNFAEPSPSYAHKDVLQRTVSDSSLDEDDFDTLEDVESEKDIFRTKTFLYVSDLARKNTQVLKKKSELYIWGLVTVAVFYAVPVMQLVVTYQRILDTTGNQDLCYYNFLCAHPLGVISDFNHVFSNIGYILFGLLFIGVCYRRDRSHREAAQLDYKLDKYYGIPQHFGMFYAMGAALFMEGLLSACYHICPNNANYQFDTAFMYVIAVLTMLKIYQTRHPDINASASGAFATLAFAVLLGVIGVLGGTLGFWILFGFIHVISCLLLSTNIYYMGRVKFDWGIHKRMLVYVRGEIDNWRSFFRPLYLDRCILLLLANIANWGLAILGIVSTPKDFADRKSVV